MRILMLGNSFTFYNHMPEMLAEITGAQVAAHTRRGARLAEHLNPNTKMGAATLRALREEKWDYVVLQEMSNGPVVSKASFLKSASALCEKIRDAGAVPVLYATWAYQKDSGKMASMNMSYDEMYQAMYDAYHQAAEDNGALIADVGKAFYELSEKYSLYASDGCHPSEKGSEIAAGLLAEAVTHK